MSWTFEFIQEVSKELVDPTAVKNCGGENLYGCMHPTNEENAAREDSVNGRVG
jgi:hypothetical protein